MSFFDLPHVFVVFQPGSGGNFVTGLCHKLLNNQLDAIEVASTGSSHTLVGKKSLGIDFLAFTTTSAQHASFASDSERISYYLEHIKEAYSDVTVPMAVWTHDFTNIPVYKKYFKNSKILVISVTSDKERLTAIIMHVLKVILDPKAVIPLEQREWEKLIGAWEIQCKSALEQMMTADQADIILSDRFNPEHKDLLTFISIKLFLGYFNVYGLIDPMLEDKTGVFDNVLYAAEDPTLNYSLGPKIGTFIDDACITLPYSYLANNEHIKLIRVFTQILDRELTAEETAFVTDEFVKYRQAQNQLLLADPVVYFNTLRLKIARLNNK